MRKFTIWWVAVVLATLFIGCGRDGGSKMDDLGDDLTAGPVSLNETAMTAVITGGSMEVFFPLDNSGGKKITGTINVSCEHLAGEQVFTGSTSLVLKAGEEVIAVRMNGIPEFDNTGAQAEWVVDYTVTLSSGKISGKRSLFMLLDKADLIIFLPNKLMEGQVSQIRAFLIDPRTQMPITDTKVQLEVTLEDETRKTYEATTDEYGVALVEMKAEDAGNIQVKALVYGEEEQGAVEAQVQVVRESKLLLTTDKPMYQPGQLIHLRALALNRFDKAPLAGDEITFEVLDANGNKVFKRVDETNEYGIAWAQFQLATKVVLGPYTIRATVGDVISEKTITVDRYALPKFKINATLDKGFYQPGQTVSGEVDVQYFFGKSVAGGTVSVQIFNYVAEWVPEQEIVGQTNDEGLYSFEYKLPDYLIGQPLEDGKALILMEVTVTDTADHEQKVAKQLLVTSKLLDVVVIPESFEVIPDVWNYFYIFVSDPTGLSVGGSVDLTVNGAEWNEESLPLPPSGPAKVALLPHEGQLHLDVAADDGNGNTATRSFDFSVGAGKANILLRTDRALYKVGDTMTVNTYVTGGYDRVFLDIVRKSQTVLTKTIQTTDGEGKLEIDLDVDLTEDLVLSAYFLTDSGQFIRDTAVVYVQPANNLNVAMTTDKDEYKPGETATIGFTVLNENNEPTPAALGIQVVDEAVYALSEMKPGLMKLYFQLEEEFQNPTYQIGSGSGQTLGGLLGASNGVESGSDEDGYLQDTTKATFAAMGNAAPGQGQVSTWQEALAQAKGSLDPFFTEARVKISERLESRLADINQDFYGACAYLQEFLAQPRYYDFWENPYRFTINGDDWNCDISFVSNGPDERADSEDDWTGSIDLWELTGRQWKGGDEFAMAGGMEDGDDWDNAGPPHEPNAEQGEGDTSGGGGNDKSGIKVRSWFPETLFVEPSLITDPDGTISVEIPLADSITEWRMTTMANSQAGDLGSRTDGIVVFQDFFVDIVFPKYLTQNDELSFPVAIYNYLPEQQSIDIELIPEDWFELLGDDIKTVVLEAGEVSVVYFPVKVLDVGWHKLTVYGIGDTLQDAIVRTVEIKPDGKEIQITESARFDNDGENPSEDLVTTKINFPDDSIAGSQSIVVKVLPGLSSHVVEGMESMLKLPGG
jgi:alpha-2-macroglobulin-like protein